MEGQKLKRLIREKFGSQANFARAAGISEPTLTQLLKMSIVGGVNALRIQRVLDQSKKREGVSMNNDHLRIDKFTGDYEIPRNLISRVIGHLLNLAIQNELARPGEKRLYPELLKVETARRTARSQACNAVMFTYSA